MSATLITSLQEQVAAWLAADGDFAGPPIVPVLTERQGDWLNKLDLEVQSGLGLCLVVSVPEIIKSPDSPTSVDASVTVHVWENVIRNMHPRGRRLPAPDAALCALGALVDREPSGGWSPLAFRDLKMARATAGGQLMYELVLRTGIILRSTRAS